MSYVDIGEYNFSLPVSKLRVPLAVADFARLRLANAEYHKEFKCVASDIPSSIAFCFARLAFGSD
jgi:hypothetical protein